MKILNKDARYVDIPTVSEVFVDSLGVCTVDEQNARLELCVTRMEAPSLPQGKPTASKYPACRLVMHPDVFLAFVEQLNRIVTTLKKQGAVAQNPPPPNN